MIQWKIEKRKISELKGYEKNPRIFTAKGLADLKKSLESCGDANIITINKDNTVLSGHARLQVMEQLGYQEVDVKVPDRLLTEKECKEIVIRLNANTAGIWDEEKLKLDFNIKDLNKWGLDLNFDVDFSNSTTLGDFSEEQTENQDNFENLPDELQNVKLEPEQFQEVLSAFKPMRERVIITYPETRKDEIAELLGLADIDKIVYTLEEIKGEENN